MPYRRPDQIRRLIITATGTPDGQAYLIGDIDRAYARRGIHRDPADVARHEPRFAHVGVHFAIYPNGGQPSGRHPLEPGRYCTGHEADSIAILLVGRTAYTRQSWAQLRACVTAMQREFPGLSVVGHHELMPDWERPGFSVPDWLDGGMMPLAGHIIN